MRCHYNATLGYQLDQEVTVCGLLHKLKLEKANVVRCRMEGDHLGEDNPLAGVFPPANVPGTSEQLAIKTFQSLLGSLLWLSRCKRPEISFSVHRAS